MVVLGSFMAIRFNTIDNPIDNDWISTLQQIEIQFFIFLHIHKMIDKPSKGLDKMFFRLRNVILLQCRPRGMHKTQEKQKQ